MPRKEVIPRRVQKLVDQCRKGKTVCMSIRHSDVGDEKVYWLEPGGKPTGEWTVKRAVDLGLLAPSEDALFPGMESQTYRVTA
jgi:hypothetical protein